MKASKFKKIFLVISCSLMICSTFIYNTLERVELISKIAAGEQLVTPVSDVAIVQSEKTNAKDLTADDILEMVSKAIDLAGGLESIITDGDTVILKPNLVSRNGKVAEANGVTTDYRIVAAVAKIARSLNPNGTIIVFEGTALNSTNELYDEFRYNLSTMPEVDAFIGLENVCGDDQDYSSLELVSVSLSDDISLYPDEKKPNKSRPIYFAKMFYNADVLISLPCLKNHESAAVTVGIKNTAIGCTPPSIYGSRSSSNYYNLRGVIDHSHPNMHKWLHDFYMCRPSDFVVVDGLQGMQHGPGGGSIAANNAQNMRLIMAGNDLVANDAISALMMGINPRRVEYLSYLHNDNAGCAEPRLVRIKGNASVSSVKKKFAHSDSRTKAAMYSDFRAPNISIVSAEYSATHLDLKLDVSTETYMVEIIIDGQKFDQVVVNQFDSISLELPEDMLSAGEVTVIAYDKYLNAAQASITAASVTAYQPNVVRDYQLDQNYPNPFNPSTTISYSLRQTEHILLKVYDINGRHVQTLVDERQTAGTHHIIFDAEGLSSGTYFYKMQAGNFIKVKRMVLLQ